MHFSLLAKCFHVAVSDDPSTRPISLLSQLLLPQEDPPPHSYKPTHQLPNTQCTLLPHNSSQAHVSLDVLSSLAGKFSNYLPRVTPLKSASLLYQ